MLHPTTELKSINEEIGSGVFATTFIPKGTIIWVLDALDIQLSATQVSMLPELLQKRVKRYGYINRHGQYILCWDFTRYFNHSCSPTSLSVNDGMDVAVRDIQQGEQITCDYGILNYIDMECHCGSPNCRKIIKATDCNDYCDIWDKEIEDAWRIGNTVNQPLLPVAEMNPNNSALLKDLAAGTCDGMLSSRMFKFNN